jgi:hypothetical protein
MALLAGCGPSPAPQPQEQKQAEEFIEDGCVVKTQSNLVTEHKVSPIYNLVKDKEELGASGRCTVRFDIKVDGVEYHLTEEEEGLEQLESLCYYARERARKNLLLDLGGEFRSEAVVACKQQDRNN